MDPHRLELLLELSRLGSMREVAEATGVSTSTVSQQLAVLATEAGAVLLERRGRQVRLTPAGRRLAAHAVSILAAIDAARADLDPAAEPAGSVRVASFATGIRESVLPLVRRLARTHPDVRLMIHEHEPPEALHRLAADDVDLAVGYDYNLAPMTLDQTVEVTPLWETKWSLGVPVRDAASSADSTEVFARFADSDWIVNSRNTADDDVVRTLASMAGFTPRIVHRADTLSLVQDMIAAGLGVGLLPAGLPTTDTVGRCPLTGPDVVLRVFALTRRGRTKWPPLATVLRMLVAPTTGS